MKFMIEAIELQGFPDCLDVFYDAEEALKVIETTVSNGKSSLESDYCLILSDLNMPLMDGYEFAQRVRHLFMRLGVSMEN